MSVEHMSRVSDIGGTLLQYLKEVVAYWRRHHEDLQPRYARVTVLEGDTQNVTYFATCY